MGRASHSCSSSIDSSHVKHPFSATSSSSSSSWSNCPGAANSGRMVTSPPAELDSRADLSTDLRVGLCISATDSASTQREQRSDWPPIKSLLRSTLNGKAAGNRRHASLFVKVYMEGIPIGRKLDLLAQDGYEALISTLRHMFRTTILYPDGDRLHSDKHHVLTYEDKEGDWMMVGDVPWEMFVTTVKRLKITRADRC